MAENGNPLDVSHVGTPGAAIFSASPLSLSPLPPMISRDEVPLAAAALQLGFPWGRAYNAMLSGELQGRQVGNRWFVSVASLEQAKAKRGPAHV